MRFVNADCDKIAIENPVGIMSTRYRKPDCIVHPWMFGDPVTKKTCWWLKNLPPLEPTNPVDLKKTDNPWEYSGAGYYAKDERGKALAWNDPRTAKIRSKTYPGIAKALAAQYGK